MRDVDAGQSVRIELAAPLPRGNAIAVVTVAPPQDAETFGGANLWREPALVGGGDPSWRRQ